MYPDSALTPASEIDSIKMPDQQAKMMSEQLSQLVGKINQTKTVIIFINEIRSTIVRIEVKDGEKIKDGIDTIGKNNTSYS